MCVLHSIQGGHVYIKTSTEVKGFHRKLTPTGHSEKPNPGIEGKKSQPYQKVGNTCITIIWNKI